MEAKQESIRLCPYCIERPATTGDHVFPQFLGGRKEIDACKECNDTFGYTFEAEIANQLAPLQLLLRTCGLPLPRAAVWKRFLKDETTGIEWDLYSDLSVRPSTPKIERDTEGKIRAAILRDGKEAERFAKSMKRKNSRERFRTKATTEQKPLHVIPPRTVYLQIGAELRRLAVKMSVALGTHQNPQEPILNDVTRAYLLGKDVAVVPVRTAYLTYNALENLRPPLAHLVFVEADREAQLCYSVIQLFGTIQLYTLLNGQYTGRSFASVAILDNVTGRESFDHSVALNLPESPITLAKEEVVRGLTIWRQKISDQIEKAFGHNPLKLKIEDSLSRNVFLPGPTISELTRPLPEELQLPIILSTMSYNLEVLCKLPQEVAMELTGADLRSYRFSTGGNDTVDFVETFIDLWKKGGISKIPGLLHTLDLPPMQILMDGKWTPVATSVNYKINNELKIKYFKARKVLANDQQSVKLEIMETIDIGDATWLSPDNPKALERFYSQEDSALHAILTKNEEPSYDVVKIEFKIVRRGNFKGSGIFSGQR